MDNITASEIAGFGVGTLLLCATIAAPKVDALISASQRRSLLISSFPSNSVLNFLVFSFTSCFYCFPIFEIQFLKTFSEKSSKYHAC